MAFFFFTGAHSSFDSQPSVDREVAAHAQDKRFQRTRQPSGLRLRG